MRGRGKGHGRNAVGWNHGCEGSRAEKTITVGATGSKRHDRTCARRLFPADRGASPEDRQKTSSCMDCIGLDSGLATVCERQLWEVVWEGVDAPYGRLAMLMDAADIGRL